MPRKFIVSGFRPIGLTQINMRSGKRSVESFLTLRAYLWEEQKLVEAAQRGQIKNWVRVPVHSSLLPEKRCGSHPSPVELSKTFLMFSADRYILNMWGVLLFCRVSFFPSQHISESRPAAIAASLQKNHFKPCWGFVALCSCKPTHSQFPHTTRLF